MKTTQICKSSKVYKVLKFRCKTFEKIQLFARQLCFQWFIFHSSTSKRDLGIRNLSSKMTIVSLSFFQKLQNIFVNTFSKFLYASQISNAYKLYSKAAVNFVNLFEAEKWIFQIPSLVKKCFIFSISSQRLNKQSLQFCVVSYWRN